MQHARRRRGYCLLQFAGESLVKHARYTPPGAGSARGPRKPRWKDPTTGATTTSTGITASSQSGTDYDTRQHASCYLGRASQARHHGTGQRRKSPAAGRRNHIPASRRQPPAIYNPPPHRPAWSSGAGAHEAARKTRRPSTPKRLATPLATAAASVRGRGFEGG